MKNLCVTYIENLLTAEDQASPGELNMARRRICKHFFRLFEALKENRAAGRAQRGF